MFLFSMFSKWQVLRFLHKYENIDSKVKLTCNEY